MADLPLGHYGSRFLHRILESPSPTSSIDPIESSSKQKSHTIDLSDDEAEPNLNIPNNSRPSAAGSSSIHNAPMAVAHQNGINGFKSVYPSEFPALPR
jgi:hypothetical protein